MAGLPQASLGSPFPQRLSSVSFWAFFSHTPFLFPTFSSVVSFLCLQVLLSLCPTCLVPSPCLIQSLLILSLCVFLFLCPLTQPPTPPGLPLLVSIFLPPSRSLSVPFICSFLHASPSLSGCVRVSLSLSVCLCAFSFLPSPQVSFSHSLPYFLSQSFSLSPSFLSHTLLPFPVFSPLSPTQLSGWEGVVTALLQFPVPQKTEEGTVGSCC